jgi:hypothetical protein
MMKNFEKLLSNEVAALREILKFDSGNTEIFVNDLEREKARKSSLAEANPNQAHPIEAV